MIIRKTIKSICFMLITTLLIGCKSSTYFKVKDQNYYVKLIIRGPGTCAHLVYLNSDGSGKVIRGRSLDSYTSEFKTFYDIEFLSYFKINSKNNLNEINDIVSKISTSELVSNDYILDSRRKEMFVNQQKKYDMYGWNGKDLLNFLEKISIHLPYDINSFCTSSSGVSEKERLE